MGQRDSLGTASQGAWGGGMTVIRFHAQAAEELREVKTWYAERDNTVAERLLKEVNNAIQRISADPESHPIELKEYRWVRVRRFPYRLIFEQQETDRILILAVAHTGRRPRYWKGRK